MKKENIYKFLYLISAMLVVAFAIRTTVDCLKYDPISNSAPFYVFVIARGIEFLLPGVIAFLAGVMAKKKFCPRYGS